MDNSAAREVQENTVLEDGTIEESMSITPSLVSKELTVAYGKSMGKTWVNAGGSDGPEKRLFYMSSKGMFKCHTLVEDVNGTVIATILILKKGMRSATNAICRSVPAYEGQNPLTLEDLKKAGIDSDDKEPIKIYPFAIIESQMERLAGAKSTYSIITGKKIDDEVKSDDPTTVFETKPLYTGKKLSAMNIYLMFKQVENDISVGKATTKGMTMNPTLEVSSGVDVLAIVCLGNTLVGDGSSAGALAGAGVV